MPIPAPPPDWLHWLERCESTNSWAMQHSDQLHHGDVVYTAQQTAGRGQRGRRWYAPPGGLTASFILDNLAPSQLASLSLVAGLAVIYAIEDLLPHLQGQLRLKWPNDVIGQDRKLAGILSEAVSNSQMTRVVVGVGLNRQVEFGQAGLTAAEVGCPVSLHQMLGANAPLPAELTLLERLRHYLGQASSLVVHSSLEAVLPALRQRDWLLNRKIGLQVDPATEPVLGQAAGIDRQGRLLMRIDGQLRAFASGRVTKIS